MCSDWPNATRLAGWGGFPVLACLRACTLLFCGLQGNELTLGGRSQLTPPLPPGRIQPQHWWGLGVRCLSPGQSDWRVGLPDAAGAGAGSEGREEGPVWVGD